MEINRETVFCAPICLFVYNRLDNTKKTIDALSKNYLASFSDLYIFSDGPKNQTDISKVSDVRKFLLKIDGFKSITIKHSEQNKGLANSIIYGVSEILQIYPSVIVLEDDLITSPNFLDFMNQSLVFYQNEPKIFSISGYSMSLKFLQKYRFDYYLSLRSFSWGWATWSNRWSELDWQLLDYQNFMNDKTIVKGFSEGGNDLPKMLKAQFDGKINSWAIRWNFNQYLKKMYTINPTISKVENIGYGNDATHFRRKLNRYVVNLDKSPNRKFIFFEFTEPNKDIKNQFKNKFSKWNRAKNKIFSFFPFLSFFKELKKN